MQLAPVDPACTLDNLSQVDKKGDLEVAGYMLICL